MFLLATEVLCMAAMAAAGIGLGWWLRGGSASTVTYEPPAAPDAGGTKDRIDRADGVLAQLQEVAMRMASDVGEHSSRMQAINDELAASHQGQAEVVVRAVTRLLQANQKMQQQLESAEDRLQQQAREIESYATLARTDALTRLPNRRAFDGEMACQLAESKRTGRPFCLAMIDVDHFKTFNDKYGHQAGDEVLRGVAEILRQNMGEGEMAARFGGEEFTVVLPATRAAEAERRVERIRQAIGDASCHFAGEELRITVSLGLAELLAGETTAELIQRADAALYDAKAAGRNCGYRHDGQATHRILSEPDNRGANSASTPQPQPAAKQAPTKSPGSKEPDGSCRAATQESPDAHESSLGLPTRMVFCTLLRRRLAEWQRGGAMPSVMLVRIDDMDRLSASQKGNLSDVVLTATARHLGACVREGDVVARYSEATLALLIPDRGLLNVAAIAERLRGSVADSVLRWNDTEIHFTVSIGVAEASPGDDTTRLLRRSEEALAASMKSGGNCCYLHNGNWSEMVKPAQATPVTADQGDLPRGYGTT